MAAGRRKRRVLYGLLGFAAVCVLVLIGMFINELHAHSVAPLSQQTLDALDLSKTDKLMIVAHPDDDAIFGGAHLLEGGWLVVCVTNGRNDTRAKEFREAIGKTGNLPLILEYPDKVNFLRDDWDSVRDGIREDLRRLIALKDWAMIVTHNEKGEYGHQHHKMTHTLTAEAYAAAECSSPLWNFGTYYKAVDLPAVKDSLKALDDETLRKKRELCAVYASQSGTVEKLAHILPYENWVPVSSGNDAS